MFAHQDTFVVVRSLLSMLAVLQGTEYFLCHVQILKNKM